MNEDVHEIIRAKPSSTRLRFALNDMTGVLVDIHGFFASLRMQGEE